MDGTPHACPCVKQTTYRLLPKLSLTGTICPWMDSKKFVLCTISFGTMYRTGLKTVKHFQRQSTLIPWIMQNCLSIHISFCQVPAHNSNIYVCLAQQTSNPCMRMTSVTVFIKDNTWIPCMRLFVFETMHTMLNESVCFWPHITFIVNIMLRLRTHFCCRY